MDLRDFGVDANPVSKNLARLLTSFDETGGIERLMDYILFQTTAINGFDNVSHFLRAGLIAAASCTRYATTVAFGCESTFGEAQVAGGPATAAKSAKIEARISDAPRASAPPIERTLGDRIEQVIQGANPVLQEQQQAEIERIRKGAENGPTGPYGDPEPFLDYLMGNDE